jgi:AcrR family transcriptional regulator
MPRKAKKPPRRRATQERSRETTAIVLEAAARVLRRHGYAGATTNRIAEAAGVSVGTLYQYFADKNEVFDALVRDYFARIVGRIREQPIDYSLPLEATLGGLIAAGVDAQRHGPGLLRALEQVPNTVFRRRLDTGKRGLAIFFREVLDHYKGLLRPIDLDRAVTLLINAAEGIGYNEDSPDYRESLASEVTDLFVRYLVDAQPGRSRSRSA